MMIGTSTGAAPAHIQAIHAGQPQVEHDQVGLQRQPAVLLSPAVHLEASLSR
jgi:hypothetical protein